MTTHTTSRSLSRRRALALGSASLSAALLAAGDQAAMAADTTPALERNRALVQRLFDDGVNGGDDHLITTLYAPGPASEGTAGEPAAVAGMPIFLPELHRAVPGVQATVEALVAEAALVAARVTWRAPHPPGGAHIVGETLHLFRIEGGQIVEQWAAGWEWLEARGVHTLCTPANPLLNP